MQDARVESASLAFGRVQQQARLTSDLQDLGGAAVDELRPQLDRMGDPIISNGVNASPDAVAGFENAGVDAACLQEAHRRQAGDARAHNGDVAGLPG